MHLSTPTQILPAEGLSQGDVPAGNAADDAPFFGQRAHMKNPPGLFSELLKALTGKAGAQPLSGEDLPPEEVFPGTEEPAESSLAWQVPGRFNQAAAAEDQIWTQNPGEFPVPVPVNVFDGEGLSAQGMLEEQGLGGQIQAALSGFRPSGGDCPGRMGPGEEAVPGLLAKKAGESLDFDLLSSRFEKGAFQPAKNAGEGREKRARTWGVEGLLAGNAGADLSRFQAAPPDAAGALDGEGENAFLAEFRDRRGRDQPAIEIRDLRSAEGRGAAAGWASAEGYKGAGFDAALPELGISVDLKPSPQLGDGWAARKTGREFSQSRLFEDALARELRGNLSMDIVKNASLVIRNGGEGTIRLALNPATLGHVKIHLEMTENKIMGHIVVESSEALRAFQRELPALERAFRDSGFIETSLDMSLAHDGGDFGAEQQRQEGEFPAMSTALSASRYDAGTELAELAEDPSVSDKLLPASAERRTVNLFI